MYKTTIDEKFDVDSSFSDTQFRKYLIRKLSAQIIKSSLPFNNLDIEKTKRQSLDLLLPRLTNKVVSAYIQEEATGQEVFRVIHTNSNELDIFNYAKKGDIKAIIELYCNNSSLDVDSIEIDKLVKKIQKNHSIKDSSQPECTLEYYAPYYRSSLVKDFIENQHVIQNVKINRNFIKRLLSLVRLYLIIYDIKTLCTKSYHNQINLSQNLKSRELSSEYHELNRIVFDAENKQYNKKYKLSKRHFDIYLDYLDKWNSGLIYDICDPQTHTSKELLKKVVKYISKS